MNGIKHFRLAHLLLCISLLVGSAFAVPVKPDLGKIFKQQQQRSRPFEPARAGWNGPEMQRPQDASPNPVLEAYGPAATTRSVRAALMAAVIPDPSAVVAIVMVIILMRIMRQTQERRRRRVISMSSPPQEEVHKAA
ncbi:MAG TPA: hypothetical protein VG897_01840 [Terriglobales bacterium]|nr:hypothetical protein [Terriglobales bacterium]